MRTICGLFAAFGLLLGAAAPAATKRTPTPPPAPQGPSLSVADKAQARKVLAAAVEKRQKSRGKPAPGPTSAGFHAHRCAVLYDQNVSGKERAANGPFRTSCSDWVSRPTKDLAIKDTEQPCTVAQYGPSLAGCTTWIDQWDSRHGKWVELWRQPSP